MNKFKEREEQINVQLERMGAPFRVETWSKWRNGVQNYVYHLNAPKYKTTLIVYDESILEESDETVARAYLRFFVDLQQELEKIEYENFLEPTWFKNHLIVHFYSEHAKNQLQQEKKAYLDYLDFVIVFSVKIPTENRGDTANMVVTEKMLERFGLTKERALEIAIANMEKEIYCEEVEKEIKNLMPGYIPCEREKSEENLSMHVVTNRVHINGASSILIPSVLQKYEGWIVLPSS
ncbi:DUF5688 family protein, partial [Mediterraneibacter faecis]